MSRVKVETTAGNYRKQEIVIADATGSGSVINPQPEGYGSRFVIHSFIHSFCHLELCSLLRHNEGTNKIAT